jgi:hypothetical protein
MTSALQLPNEPLVVCGRIDVDKRSFIRDWNIQDRVSMSIHNRLCSDRWIASTKIVEQLAIEHNRMAVPIPVDGSDECHVGMSTVRIEHGTNRTARDEREVDERDEHAADSGTIGRTHAGL